jgi:phosphoglycerate dehydrogenase-like enzyme
VVNILVTLREEQYGDILDEESFAKLCELGKVVSEAKLPRDQEEPFLDALKRHQAEVVLTCWGSPKLTLKVYRANPQLKYRCHAAGTVRPYLDRECIEAGLRVTNWGTIIARSVAEGALMMILSSLRRTTLIEMELHVRKGWRPRGRLEAEGLFHQRVGLVGLGAIAQELVKLLAPFDCELSAYSPHCPDDVFEQSGVTRVATLTELFRRNRIISVHASNVPTNHHIINADVLACLRDGGVLVNTARGAVINTKDLIAELRKKRLWAALDVFEEEPLPQDSPLRGMENCQLIPHMAGPTADRRVDMGKLAVENIGCYVRGEELLFPVTAEKYDLIT